MAAQNASISTLLKAFDVFCYPESAFWVSSCHLLCEVFSLQKDLPSNNATNNSYDSVDFTLCFQDITILSIICGFFWVFVIIHLIFTEKNVPSLPYSWLNVTKIVRAAAINHYGE
jgi:hypothetical protein